MEINIIKEDLGYSALIKSLRICTQGDTFEELIQNLNEAILLNKENYIGNEQILEVKNFNLVI